MERKEESLECSSNPKRNTDGDMAETPSGGNSDELMSVPKFSAVIESFSAPQGAINLPLNCNVIYVQHFVPEDMRSSFFQTLAKELPWENHGMRRDTVLYGESNILYPYGKGYGQETSPRPWHPTILKIKEMVEAYTKEKFNICLCGWYLNGTKSIGFHSDREESGKTTPIASISLGADRYFEFKEKKSPGTVPELFRMLLHNGSLLVMGEFSQDRYLHSLPVDKNVTAPRINLTFRNAFVNKNQ